MPQRAADNISTAFRNVEDLGAYRRRRLATAIFPQLLDPLRRGGDVIRHLDDPDQIDLWREAGRIAGRKLGVHVRTGQTGCGCPDGIGVHVRVVNLDAEVTDGEMRVALNRLTALIDGPGQWGER